MSEDSWSSSDSGSSSDTGASSSGGDTSSGSDRGWPDAATYAAGEVAGGILDSLLEPSARPASQSSQAAETAALLNPAIQALVLAGAGQPAADERSLVRQIAEAAHWYAPRDSNGALLVETFSAADPQFHDAFTVPLGHRQPKRSGRPPGAARESRGKRDRLQRRDKRPPSGPIASSSPGAQPEPPRTLLRIWPEDPGRPARVVSGYELARLLPPDLGALVVMRDKQPTLGLWPHEFQRLAAFADGREFEALLLNPGPGQLEALRSARWWLPNGRAALRAETYGFERLVRVYTQPEDGYEDEQPLQEISGALLCERLAPREDYDGIAVNITTGVRDGARHEPRFEFGPDYARQIVAGVDPRPGVGPLPARTLAEVALWAEIVEFAWEGREIVPVNEPPGAVQVRAVGASRWRPDQPCRATDYRPGPVAGPIFTISQPDLRPGDLGDGVTRILCAGLLAQHLYNKGSWHPSAWFVTRSERVKAAKMAAIATELLKLLPPGADALPRDAIRTVAGSSFLHRKEWCGTRRWIEEHHARFHRAATHWLPSFW